MSTFKLKSVVVEEVGAWEKCSRCCGYGEAGHGEGGVISCPTCFGDGGKWSDAYKSLWDDEEYLVHADEEDKSTILTRVWALCSNCKGTGSMVCENKDCEGTGYLDVYEKQQCSDCHGEGYVDCDHCHKDEQGNPTGCEPGTQGKWEVRR